MEVLEHITFRNAEGQLFKGGEPTLLLHLNIKQGEDMSCGGREIGEMREIENPES